MPDRISKDILCILFIIIFDRRIPKTSMTTTRHIAIVCNPRAGKGKALQLCKQLAEKLTACKISCEIFSDQWPSGFNGFTDVFIAGGDGTLNYFINQYPSISLPLVIFKGGSGNDFAWKLYGDISFEEQFEKALHGEPLAVDAGICNGRYFLNGVGIGFDGVVVKAMGRKRFISASHVAYLWTVIKKILFYREKEMQLRYGGVEYRKKMFMISIANGSRYGGGFLVAPDSAINDGLLDMVTITCIHPLRRFYYLPKVQKGKHTGFSFVKIDRITRTAIRTDKEIAGHIDGELIEDKEFDITMLPGRYLFRY